MSCGGHLSVPHSPDWAVDESESLEWAPWSLPAWFSSFAGETNPIYSLVDQSLEEDSWKERKKDYCTSYKTKHSIQCGYDGH